MPTAGVTMLRLVAAHCVPTGAHQQFLWSTTGESDERAHRALARVQTLLGHGSVLTPVLDGGRTPMQRTTLVPWGDEPLPQRGPDRPWPGHLGAPAPSVLIDPPRSIRVLDETGRSVTVTPRGAVPLAPAQLDLGNGPPVSITAWAGPWPVDDNWWGAGPAGPMPPTQYVPLQRRARFQLVDLRGRAYLAVCSFPLEPPGLDSRAPTPRPTAATPPAAVRTTAAQTTAAPTTATPTTATPTTATPTTATRTTAARTTASRAVQWTLEAIYD